MVAVAEIASACCGATSSAQAQSQPSALPTGGVAVHGSALFNTGQANKLVVTTQNGAGTNHSAINWNSFSIGAGNTTQFVQPSAASTSINRVVTNTPTELFGTLSSNGKLVLVNQSGIAVGAGAVVDTAGFTASAMGMSEADAIAGRLRFGGSGLYESGGALTVQGNVIARGGDVVLIAPSIDLAKTAVVEAQGGSVILAAGHGVEVTGRGLEGITLQVQAPADRAVNLGTLKGDAVGIFAGNLKHSGMIQASTANLEGGKVVLKAVDLLEIDGQVKAVGTGGKGGVIHATADKIVLRKTADVDASGMTGGGEIRIGGGWHGEDARISNANQSVVLEGAQIKANAIDRGDGGSVVVWADGATRFLGSVSARGGSAGGDGGHAEVSGKQYLDFRGAADLSSPMGSKGSLLLDPINITISAGPPDLNGDSTPGDDVTAAGIVFADFGTSNSVITATQVGTLLNTGNLVLEANNNLTVASPISKSGAGATSLTLHGSNNVIVNSPITTTGGALNITMLAAGGLAINANVNAGTGNVTLTGNSGITQSGGGITGATLTASSASGNVTLNGANSVTTARFPNAGTVQFNNTAAAYSLGGTGASSLTVTGTGAVTIDQAVTYPNVNISSNGGITVGASITSPLALNLTTVNNLISQSGLSHQITSGPATVNAGTFDITLGNSNDFSTLNLTGANILVKDVNALNVTTLNYGVGSNVYLEAGGALTLPAGNILTTGQLSLYSGTTLTTPGNLSGSTVILEGPLGLNIGNNVTATGPLFLTGGATSGVNQTAGAITATGGLTTVSASTSPVNLNQPGNNFSSIAVTGGGVQLRDANGFALGNVVANTLDVNSSSGGGAITQLPGTSIATAFGSTFNTNGGAVTLTNTGNSLGSFQTTSTAAGAVNLTHGSNSLDINLTSAGLLNVQSSGSINLNNTITTTGAANIVSTGGSIFQNYMAPVNAGGTIKLRAATGLSVGASLNASAGGDSIILASTTGLFNWTGPSVTMGAGGRWLLYLDNPTASHTYGLTFTMVTSSDFRQYGAPYGTTPLGSGNGTLFAVAPVLTGTLTGTVTKTYDGTTSIGMTGAGLTSVSGYLFGDLGGSISGVGTLANPNVGSGILVTVANGTVTGVTDTDTFSTSYGYKINATGNIGIVTPALVTPVSTIGLSGIRSYDGTNIVNANIFSLGGLVGSETLSLSGSGLLADKNVGVNKPVSLGSLTLGNGTGLASNYTLSGGTHVATITPAVITGVSGITATNKVYDGTTVATLVTSSAVLPGRFGSDSVTVSGATGAFADRNTGSAKPVTVTGLTLTGADAANYTLAATTASAGKADITVRPLSTWTGVNGGAWNSASNWDALPDGNNVLAVSIPAGAGAVTFDASVGPLSLQSLSSSRPLVISGGSLAVSSNLAIPGLTLSAGSLTGTGGLNIGSSLNQTGGNIVMGGNVVANQSSGDMVVGTMSAPSIALSAQAGSITQTGRLATASLLTSSATGTNLTNTGNQISRFNAGNTGPGSIALNNSAPLEIAGVVNTGGDVTINNVGGVVTTGLIISPKAAVNVTANSPLTIGAAGVTAGGDITLAATNLTSAGNLTLNGPVTSDGVVNLRVGNDLVQNSAVYGAGGILASAGRSVVFGPQATSGRAPVVYTSGSSPVSAPTPATARSSSSGDVIVSFLNLFEKAVESQKEEIFITRSDGTTRRKAGADAITSEGEICRP